MCPGGYSHINRPIHHRAHLACRSAQERDADPYHVIDPGLERCWHTVVMHWRGNQQQVAGLQLANQFVGTVQCAVLRYGFRPSWVGQGLGIPGVDGRQVIEVEIGDLDTASLHGQAEQNVLGQFEAF